MRDDKIKSAKEAMKTLREQRKPSIDRARKAIAEQNRAIKAIRQALGEGAGTVPEIARATRLATSTVMVYIATLKKYGTVLEGAKDGDYFKYELAGE
jgi:hypothetical protein